MKTKEKQKNIPKLRFLEFSGEWEEKKLEKIFDNVGGTALEKFVDKNKTDFTKVNNFSEAAEFLKKYLKNKKTPSIQLDARRSYVVLISPAAAHFYSKFVEGSGKSLKEWCLLISKI